MTDMAAQTCRRYWQQAEGRRAPFEERWNDICRVFMPGRKGINRRAEGTAGDQAIYETTPAWAAEVGAAALFSFITTPTTYWFIARAEDDRLNKKPAVRRWLFDTRNRVYSVMTGVNSGFYSAAFEFFRDLLTVGTAYIHQQVVDHTYRYRARPFGEWYVLTDDWGRLMHAFRKYELYPWQAAQQFPGDQVIEAQATGSLYGTMEFIQWLYPEGNGIASVHYHNWRELARRRFNRWPIVFSTWMNESDETYGRSPGWLVLPDAKLVQAYERACLRGYQKLVDPPIVVRDRSTIGKSQLSLDPGKMIAVNGGLGGKDALTALVSNARPDLGEHAIDRKVARINAAFFVDVMLQLSNRGGASPLKAAEAVGRREEVLRLMGPYVMRMHQQFLAQTADAVYAELQRRGTIEAPPREMRGEFFNFEFASTAALAQRRTEVDEMTGWLGAIAPFIQMQPQAAQQIIDVEAGILRSAELFALHPDLIKSPDAREQERQLAAQTETMQALAAGGMTAESVGKGAQAVQEAGLI